MKIPFSIHIWEEVISFWKEKSAQKVETNPEKNKSFLKIIFWSKAVFKTQQKEYYALDRAWERINRRINRQKHRLAVSMQYAAIGLLLIGISWYFRVQHGEQWPVVKNIMDTIKPGEKKAELLLADGERIPLNLETKTKKIQHLGVALTNDIQNSCLSYEGTSSGDTLSTAYNTLFVPKGGEYTLLLPDGTRIWLNSETSLRFPLHFARNKREVYLDGEAYFKVKRDTAAPFSVYTSGREIKVLGTSFNVSAYAKDKWWQTTLVEGKVEVNVKGKKVLMKPSEQYSVDNMSSTGQLRKVDAECYTSWINGKFYFNAYAFEELVNKLERWYDFTMIYQSEEIKRMRFTGIVNKHAPIEDMLKYLEMTTDIHFSISGKNIIAEKNGI